MEKNIFEANVTWKTATEVVRKKKGWRQEDLANFIGLDDSTVSKMGKGWELHWKCFLKLLPYFIEYNVDLGTTSDNSEQSSGSDNNPNMAKSQEKSAENASPDRPIMSPFIYHSFLIQ